MLITVGRRSKYFVLACLLLGLAVALVIFRKEPAVPASSLKLPDGAVVRVLAVTYGTNHVVGPLLGGCLARLPRLAQAPIVRLFGNRAALVHSQITASPALVVWLDDSRRGPGTAAASPGPGYMEAFLADAAGFVSGDGVYLGGWWSNPVALTFYSIPRRDRVISLAFFHHDAGGTVKAWGKLSFKNPCFKRYPHWRPEPLPVTKRSRDVEMKVQKLSTGHDEHTTYTAGPHGSQVILFGTNRLDGRNRSVCLCTLRSLINTNEVWYVANEEASDATGNRVKNTSIGWGSHEQGYFTFQPSLWTSEAAWKLNCEIKRAKGFAAGETFTFRNVPLGDLGTTNLIGWETNFNGVTVTLDQLVRRAPNTNNSWSLSDLSQVRLKLAVPNGMHVDWLSAQTDTGVLLESGSWESSGPNRSYSFRAIPIEAATADFTFAVQQSRWIEFTLKPEVGAARVEVPPPHPP